MADERQGIVLPAGVERPGAMELAVGSERDSGRAVIFNETGLPDPVVEAAASDYFVEQASVGGIARGPSNFATYSANQGSMLARTEFRTPTNVIEEIRLARELAERDDDVGSTIGQMIALAFGEGMENAHEDERTLAIYNAIAREMNLDRVWRELYREYLIASTVTTVSLFTRTLVDYNLPGSESRSQDLLSHPLVGVMHAENIRILDNDMFGTGTLAFDPPDENLRKWLDEYFNPETSPARKAQMGREDRVLANLFTGVYEVNPFKGATELYTNSTRLYLINPRMVQRMSMAKGEWKYPRPLLTRNFALLEAKRLLNLMDYALLQGGANFIVVAKKGSDQLPAQPAELNNLREVVRRASRTGVIVGDHRLTFDVITPELKELLNPEKRNLIGRKLAMGLLRLTESPVTDGGQEGMRTDTEVMSRVIANDRLELKRMVERGIYHEISKRNPRFLDKGAAKVWFPKIILQGTQYFNDMVLKLRDRGDIPRRWAAEAAGFDWDAGVQQRKRELARGDDEVMMPGAVPHSSPEAGPQDNGPGRPAGSRDGNGDGQLQRPQRTIRQTQGETIRAYYDEQAGHMVRIGTITETVLEQYEEPTQGRITTAEREVADEGQMYREGPTAIVPVNVGVETIELRAVRLTEGLRMIVGRTPADEIVAKAISFREPEFNPDEALTTVARWGYPVPETQSEPRALPPAPEEQAQQPVIIVHAGGGEPVEMEIVRDEATGQVVGSRPKRAEPDPEG